MDRDDNADSLPWVTNHGVRVMHQHEVVIDDSLKMAVSRWQVLKIKN